MMTYRNDETQQVLDRFKLKFTLRGSTFRTFGL